MTDSLEEPKHKLGRKTRSDAKLVRKQRQTKTNITREQFHDLVKKAAQPVPNEPDATSNET